MALFLATAPTVEPVTLTQAKDHLRIVQSEKTEHELIGSLIKAARLHVENWTQRALISQTWDLKLDWFPDCRIELPKPPVSAISSISYVDTAGATQTWSSALYRTSLPTGEHAGPAFIEPAYGESYPVTRDVMDAVTVRFVCGYGASGAAVPTPIRQAMLLLVGHWYANRETVNVGNLVTPLPHAVEALLMPFRVAL